MNHAQGTGGLLQMYFCELLLDILSRLFLQMCSVVTETINNRHDLLQGFISLLFTLGKCSRFFSLSFSCSNFTLFQKVKKGQKVLQKADFLKYAFFLKTLLSRLKKHVLNLKRPEIENKQLLKAQFCFFPPHIFTPKNCCFLILLIITH